MTSLYQDLIYAIQEAKESVSSALHGDMTEENLLDTLRGIYSWYDSECADFFTKTRPSPCLVGCSLCCHVQVELTTPELLLIFDYLKNKPDVLGTSLGEACRQAPQIWPMSVQDRTASRLPCPFLGQDQRCAIYPARPLACRRYHVADVSFCKQAFGKRDATVPIIGDLYCLPLAIGAGFSLGLEDAGLFDGFVELVTAAADAASILASGQDLFKGYLDGNRLGKVTESNTDLKAFVKLSTGR